LVVNVLSQNYTHVLTVKIISILRKRWHRVYLDWTVMLGKPQGIPHYPASAGIYPASS